MNNISEERRRTFKAAWEIQRMMYSEGFWVSELWYRDKTTPRRMADTLGDCVMQSDRYSPSENQSNCEPQMGTRHGGRFGSIFSREGLLVVWAQGFPTWMETPWGEWWCWAEEGPGQGTRHYAGYKYHREFLSRVQANKKPETGIHTIELSVLRQVGEITLPQHSRVGGNELPQEEMVARSAEWVTLCEEMEPKRFPHWFTYVQADLPIPKNHPHYAYAQKQIVAQLQPRVSGPLTSYGRKHAPV